MHGPYCVMKEYRDSGPMGLRAAHLLDGIDFVRLSFEPVHQPLSCSSDEEVVLQLA